MASPLNIAQVAKRRKELQDKYGDKSIWLVTNDSPDNQLAGVPAGRVSDAAANAAAFAIARGTHRIAEDHEVAAFHASLKTRTEDLTAREHASRQMYALPPELADLVKAAATRGKKD